MHFSTLVKMPNGTIENVDSVDYAFEIVRKNLGDPFLEVLESVTKYGMGEYVKDIDNELEEKQREIDDLEDDLLRTGRRIRGVVRDIKRLVQYSQDEDFQKENLDKMFINIQDELKDIENRCFE